MPSSERSEEVSVGFVFRDMDEVNRAIAQNWSGTFSPEMLRSAVQFGDILSRQFTPYKWKIEILRPGTAPQRKMRDTWLTEPYVPRSAAKKLP